ATVRNLPRRSITADCACGTTMIAFAIVMITNRAMTATTMIAAVPKISPVVQVVLSWLRGHHGRGARYLYHGHLRAGLDPLTFGDAACRPDVTAELDPPGVTAVHSR